MKKQADNEFLAKAKKSKSNCYTPSTYYLLELKGSDDIFNRYACYLGSVRVFNLPYLKSLYLLISKIDLS